MPSDEILDCGVGRSLLSDKLIEFPTVFYLWSTGCSKWQRWPRNVGGWGMAKASPRLSVASLWAHKVATFPHCCASNQSLQTQLLSRNFYLHCTIQTFLKIELLHFVTLLQLLLECLSMFSYIFPEYICAYSHTSLKYSHVISMHLYIEMASSIGR